MGMATFWQGMTTALQNPSTLDIAQQVAPSIGASVPEANAMLMWGLGNGQITPSSSPEQIANTIASNWQDNQASSAAAKNDPMNWIAPMIALGGPMLAGAIAGGSLGGLFGSAGSGEAASLSPYFENAWAANNAAALNLGGVTSAVPELNLLGSGASSLASSIPSLANALSAYGVTPIPSQAVYDAANMISTTTPWDQVKNFTKDNLGSIAKTASSMFQKPAGQALPSIPDFSIGASGGTQPNQQRPIAQQQQSQPSQLSVPQFNQMSGPQQDYGNYQAPQFMDAPQSWGQPSIFQLSQSTWNPSMANALRSYNA